MWDHRLCYRDCPRALTSPLLGMPCDPVTLWPLGASCPCSGNCWLLGDSRPMWRKFPPCYGHSMWRDCSLACTIPNPGCDPWPLRPRLFTSVDRPLIPPILQACCYWLTSLSALDDLGDADPAGPGDADDTPGDADPMPIPGDAGGTPAPVSVRDVAVSLNVKCWVSIWNIQNTPNVNNYAWFSFQTFRYMRFHLIT
jgi:hypothetical protein